MKRTKKKTGLSEWSKVFEQIGKAQKSGVDAILTADWHLREDQPICRVDDFWKAQWRAVDTVAKLAEKCKCPVLHAGDLFHHWKPSPRLLTYTLRHLPRNFWTVYGQHDLPQHNMDLVEKSGINLLHEVGKVRLLNGHWATDPNEIAPNLFSKRPILVWHKLVYQSKPYPGASGGMAEGIIRKYKQYDLILTGDNHQAFNIEYKNRILVNPGNLTRQSASQHDFRPRVYLWNAKENTVEKFYLPIEKEAVTRTHIESKARRDERIGAFVERLNTDWESSLDFKENLKRLEAENDVPKEVMEVVYKVMEE